MTTLDLTLTETCSLKTLAITDVSFYDNVKPKNISLEVTPPGYNKVNLTFIPGSTNVYNSIALNVTCNTFSNIPDGLYTVKYSIQPNSTFFIEKTFLRTTLLQCKYQKVLLSLHSGNSNPELKNKITDIRLLIEGAIAASNDCQPQLAYELYDEANCLLDKIKDCGCE